MKLPVVDSAGQPLRTIEADDAVFGLQPNLAVVHQVLVAYQANRRHGTHSTQTRSQHHGSTAKSRRQKGLGRARLGSVSSPVRRGGAVAHGPHPHSYRQRVPKRLRRLAIRSLLSQRVVEGGLIVLADGAAFAPKTQAVQALLTALGVERSALVVTRAADALLQRGIRNLPRMHTCPADTLNVERLLWHDHIILTESALRRAEALWGGDRARLRRAPIPATEEA